MSTDSYSWTTDLGDGQIMYCSLDCSSSSDEDENNSVVDLLSCDSSSSFCSSPPLDLATNPSTVDLTISDDEETTIIDTRSRINILASNAKSQFSLDLSIVVQQPSNSDSVISLASSSQPSAAQYDDCDGESISSEGDRFMQGLLERHRQQHRGRSKKPRERPTQEVRAEREQRR